MQLARTSFAAALFVAMNLLAVPADAAPLTAKEAVKVMVKAGYSGIAGVTRSDRFYYAAAISPERRRVRVTVDQASGKIVSVLPLALGSGAQPVMPPSIPRPEVGPIVNKNPYEPMFPPYKRPPPPHPIGVIQYPFNAYGQPQKSICRYRANAPGC